MKRISLLCVLSLVLCAVATADIIPTWTSTIPSGSVFSWVYDVVLTADQKLIGGLNGSLPNSVSNLDNSYAAFFTIYDFYGFNGATAAPAGWVLLSLGTGITPNDVAPVDNGIIPNVTWVYTGAITLSGAQDLGTFVMQSTTNRITDVSFAARAFRNSGDRIGDVIDNVGPTAGPAGVPEPATIGLIGVGLVGLGLLRRKAHKS